MRWLDKLRGNPIPWLLEEENPAPQLPDGAWPLDQSPYRLTFDVGQPGEPNKWVTLDAMRVIKLFSGQGYAGGEAIGE